MLRGRNWRARRCKVRDRASGRRRRGGRGVRSVSGIAVTACMAACSTFWNSIAFVERDRRQCSVGGPALSEKARGPCWVGKPR
jgi:hypothetical protein